jgi:hypothetical protein
MGAGKCKESKRRGGEQERDGYGKQEDRMRAEDNNSRKTERERERESR